MFEFLGISIKVFVVDLTNETISFPVTIRAALTQTVGDLKKIVAEELGVVSAENLHCVLQTHSELKALNDPGRLLKVEEFTRSNKVNIKTATDVSTSDLWFLLFGAEMQFPIL